MNTKSQQIEVAYDNSLKAFENYAGILENSLTLDSDTPEDLILCVRRFAGFCDRFDEVKATVFENFLRYAVNYYEYFKDAPKQECLDHRSNSPKQHFDPHLIDYVMKASSAEDFLNELTSSDSNIQYLYQQNGCPSTVYSASMFSKLNQLISQYQHHNSELKKQISKTK